MRSRPSCGAILAEERPGRRGPRRGGGRGGLGARRWILDPIDGTRNYSRGIPVWATLIALEEDGVVQLGVVSAPALGQRWWAEREAGSVRERRADPRLRDLEVEDAVLSFAIENEVPAVARRAWHARGFGDFWALHARRGGRRRRRRRRARRERVGSRGDAGDRRGGRRPLLRLPARRASTGRARSRRTASSTTSCSARRPNRADLPR